MEKYTELFRTIIRGEDPYKAVEVFSKKLQASRNRAVTLIYTEYAAVASAAAKDCFGELDVEEYEIVATLDSHTSGICQSMDGKTCYVPADMKYGEWKEKYVAKRRKDDILKEENNTEEVVNVHFIGKLDKNIYQCVTEDIVTDEVIITDNQIEHIKERHPKDYNDIMKYISKVLINPDYILVQRKLIP